MAFLDQFVFDAHAQASNPPARTLSDLDDILVNAMNKIWPFFGMAFFAMLIWGGAMWLMSAGDPQKLQKAQGTLLWAVVGIVILVLLMWIFGTFEYIFGINSGEIGNFTI
jgi:hypothetical protein